jgi:hypothetical protein
MTSFKSQPFRPHMSRYVERDLEDRTMHCNMSGGDAARSASDQQMKRRSSSKHCLRKDADMTNTLKPDVRMTWASAAVIAMASMLGLCSQARAQGAAVQDSSTGRSVVTSRGPAFITGHLGSLETTTLPGSGGQGFLMNNGNGTSTLIVPGGVPQVIATPR